MADGHQQKSAAAVSNVQNMNEEKATVEKTISQDAQVQNSPKSFTSAAVQTKPLLRHQPAELKVPEMSDLAERNTTPPTIGQSPIKGWLHAG